MFGRVSIICKNRRKELRLTQRDLSARVGIHHETYAKFEAGGDIKLSNLAEIIKALNLTMLIIPPEHLQP